MINLNVFKQFSNNKNHNQQHNEALVLLGLLLYRADGKIDLSEQALYDQFLKAIDWQSGISIQSYINTSLAKIRKAENKNNLVLFFSTGLFQ